jgi:isocitrate/isopropylmalate dehydrogenase
MNVLVLAGDGIGPEITQATMTVLHAAVEKFALPLEFETREVGLESLSKLGTTLHNSVLKAARESRGVILGPVSHYGYPPRDQGGINVSSEFRIHFDLFANIRPSRSRTGIPYWGRTPMDLVIVRENTEGFYADRNMFVGPGEFMPTAELALSLRKVTTSGCRRLAKAAFGLAMKRRHKVTAVHKANVLKLSEGVFLGEIRQMAKNFPSVEVEEILVDAMASYLVRDAARFDVIVTTNMFGDILSDEAAELSGSLGLAAGLNVGDTLAVAQAQHGSAPDIAGRGIANPTSLILSSAMLLAWMGEYQQHSSLVGAAKSIEAALDATLTEVSNHTADLGGTMSTQEFATVVAKSLNVA